MILKLIKFNCVKSTNDEAIKIIKSGKKSQGIIISNIQTKGRGTMGKKWISYNGNFFASIFFELKKLVLILLLLLELNLFIKLYILMFLLFNN